MNTQPEALRLADSLAKCWGDSRIDETIAELRRLHEVNQELLEALKLITEVGDRSATEISRAAIAKATN